MWEKTDTPPMCITVQGWHLNILMFVQCLRQQQVAQNWRQKKPQCKKRMKGSKRNVSSPNNYRMFYSYCKDREANWPIFLRLTHANRRQSLVVVFFFSLLHHYVPNTAESEHSSFNALWMLQAPAYSLAVISQTVPILCRRMLFSKCIGASLMQ